MFTSPVAPLFVPEVPDWYENVLTNFRMNICAVQAVGTTFEPTLYGLALDLCGSLGQIGKHLQMTLIRALKVR